MSLIGRSFKVVDISKLRDFDIDVGDVLKVQDEYVTHLYGCGATKVERIRDGKSEILGILHHQAYWCIFSEGMISKGDLVEVFTVIKDCTTCIDTGIKVSGVGICDADDKTKDHIKSVVTAMNNDLMKTLEERYNNWVVENIHVYELFCEFAIKAIQSGKKKISHWLIVNRLRWEVEIETKGTCYQDKDFKISNDYIAFLARDFMKDYPQYGEVFTIKQMKRV